MSQKSRIFMKEVRILSKGIYRWFKSPVFRVHIMKIIAVSLTVLLLATAYSVHVIHAEEYTIFNSMTTTANLRQDVSRGVIFDRNGEPLVSNRVVSVITYRHVPNTYTGEMRRIANELAQLIDFTDEEINSILTSFRDKQDLFIFLNFAYARDLVPEEDRIAAGNDNALFHTMMIDQITEEHVARLTDEEIRAHAIFTRMYQGAGRTTNIIKEEPTTEEVARIMENLSLLPGIDVGVDWEREYPSDLNRSFFGDVSTHQQGIPLDRAEYFLSQGYSPSARVGRSQIERTMHAYLSGFAHRYIIDDGIPTQLSEGVPGFEMTLNLDAEFQLMAEAIVSEHVLNERNNHFYARFLDEAYAVIANPRTGAVLAMVGVIVNVDANGNLYATMNPLGTFQRATTLGSAVKGATLIAGYMEGVTYVGQHRWDSPIRIQASEDLRSWQPMGLLCDRRAIVQSSNVYFYRQSMQLADVFHSQGGPILNWGNDRTDAFGRYRRAFGQLGLGTRTGIELPHEQIGFQAAREFNNLMLFSIGQADTYTAMQMAQFGAVLATGGDRMQMQLVQNIYMPGSNGEERQLVRGFQPNLLNRVELTDEQWDVIQSGHRGVVAEHGGTARWIFEEAAFLRAAGKTGTAEDYRRDENGHIVFPMERINHRTFVGYAPYDDPEIVVAVVTPQSETPGLRNVQNLSAVITRELMIAYFELQAERANGR